MNRSSKQSGPREQGGPREPEPLPVEVVMPQIVAALREQGRAVIAAPPGAGKSTLIPPRLLTAFPGQGKILLLQPRRMAARAVAARIAQLLDTSLGQRVGYQVRMDRQWGGQTDIVVMTYGVLLRRLLSDPCLDAFGTVLLDEFHERSLEADLCLGMLERLRRELREDLRLAVMSATLDAQPIAAYLQDAPWIASPGRMFPVDIRYAEKRNKAPISDQVAQVLPEAMRATSGDVLVFLPGVGEIRQLHRQIRGAKWLAGVEVLQLYGDLPPEKQDRVLAPAAHRKLVLSTNVAETSITIEGVTCVIDSGQARILRTDPNLGLQRLDVEPISQAAADQRAGRAGRTQPGVCYRLWMQMMHRSRAPFDVPEIERGDLAAAVLQLVGWGEHDVLAFPWLTPPRPEAVASATLLLERLGAMAAGKITELGKQLLTLPAHPRLGRLMLAGIDLGIPRTAAICAAMLAERDPFVDGSGPQLPWDELRLLGLTEANFADRVLRLEAWIDGASDQAIAGSAGRAVRQASRQFLTAIKQLGEISANQADTNQLTGTNQPLSEQEIADRLGQALLIAFPDRLARRRHPQSERGLMVGNTGVHLKDPSISSDMPYFLCINVLRKHRDADVRRAVPIAAEWLTEPHLSQQDECFFHPSQRRVVGRRRGYWLDLMLQETPGEVVDAEQAAAILAEQVIANWKLAFPTDQPQLTQWVARANFLAKQLPDEGFPTVDEATLQATAVAICQGKLALEEVRKAPWVDYLKAEYGFETARRLDQLAPVAIEVPSGKKIKIDYNDPAAPSIKVRLQEIFGWQETPRVAGGSQPLLLRILAPNHREVQVTQDLENFWRSTYIEVRKELRRRYPKHHWPDDPAGIKGVRPL